MNISNSLPPRITTSSLVWLGFTTLLGLVLTLTAVWGASISSTTSHHEVRLDVVETHQAVEDERYKDIQKSLNDLKLQGDQILYEQQRLRMQKVGR